MKLGGAGGPRRGARNKSGGGMNMGGPMGGRPGGRPPGMPPVYSGGGATTRAMGEEGGGGGNEDMTITTTAYPENGGGNFPVMPPNPIDSGHSTTDARGEEGGGGYPGGDQPIYTAADGEQGGGFDPNYGKGPTTQAFPENGGGQQPVVENPIVYPGQRPTPGQTPQQIEQGHKNGDYDQDEMYRRLEQYGQSQNGGGKSPWDLPGENSGGPVNTTMAYPENGGGQMPGQQPAEPKPQYDYGPNGKYGDLPPDMRPGFTGTYSAAGAEDGGGSDPVDTTFTSPSQPAPNDMIIKGGSGAPDPQNFKNQQVGQMRSRLRQGKQGKQRGQGGAPKGGSLQYGNQSSFDIRA